MMEKNFLFVGTPRDKVHLHKLIPIMQGNTTHLYMHDVKTLTEVALHCKVKKVTQVLSTSESLLAKVSQLDSKGDSAKISNYAGSLFKRSATNIGYEDIEYLFIPPLEQLNTVTYGDFLLRRYVSKFLSPGDWNRIPVSEFDWCILTEENADELYQEFSTAQYIAVDIETVKEGLRITEIGYCAIWINENAGTVRTRSIVLPVDTLYALAWMRRFNDLDVPKIGQNFRYDLAYLQRYNAVPRNYKYDTATMMHSWYSELPKDLGFLGAFFLRNCVYWKDLAKSYDKYEQYKYNARDTWSTANVFVQWIATAPAWALKNYIREFPLIYPCHLSEMIGIKRDSVRLQERRADCFGKIREIEKSLDTMLAKCIPEGHKFNPSSSKQVISLMQALGVKDTTSSDDKHLEKARYAHPLNARILGLIQDHREYKKLVTTYLRTDADITATSKKGSKDFMGRVLYALNPGGTDSGRLASGEHAFWTGFNMQNQPRGELVKSTYVADTGFLFGECDLEQAESRDTAHIAGEERMIQAVTGVRDFHSVNLCAFFGRNYEDVYDDVKKKSKDSALRDLAKRVNHGANYNMGEAVLLETMGIAKVELAAKLLELPKFWTHLQVCKYLLERFHATYPGMRSAYYPQVIAQIMLTGLLTGATGWSRYCFGNPKQSKQALNAYVAHCPQSLNAMKLNQAYLEVFKQIAMHPEDGKDFKLLAQIHDSILFQFREGRIDLAHKVKELMEVEVSVVGADRKTRTYTVPAALKLGKEGKGTKYWSEL